MTTPADQLEQLVAQVLASPKYRAICPDLVRSIGARELRVRRSPKEALKETRSRLHQVAGAFLDRPPQYQDWLAALQAASGDDQALRAVGRMIMGAHASTRERLPVLDHFYSVVLRDLPPPTSLIDVACGLNPLAAPWMPLAPGASYYACDLYADMCAFVGAALPLLGLLGEATVCDLSDAPPPWRADLALVLKTLPVLEHVRRGAGRDLLRSLAVRHLVVSFPTRSLGGRNVGMAATYGEQMRAISEGEGWAYSTLEFANEVVFVVRKG